MGMRLSFRKPHSHRKKERKVCGKRSATTGGMETPFLKLTPANPKNKEMWPKSTQGKFLTPKLANPHTKKRK